MSKPQAPSPPDPVATGAAQTGTNVSTAVANAFLNNMNQITPEGSLNYDQTGNYSWTDPSTGTNYNIPRFTVSQQLSQTGTDIQNQLNAAKMNLAGMANSQSANIADLLSSDMRDLTQDWAGTPGGGAPLPGRASAIYDSGDALKYMRDTGEQQGTFGDVGNQQYTFDNAGNIVRSYGPADNFSADRARVEQALYERMDPQLQQDEARLRQQLADQGIRYGSQAYEDAWANMTRQRNDARLAITQTAGQEQQRMMDMAAQEAGFENAAQKQAYEQALGRGTFANQAQQTAFQQAQARGSFMNEAQKQAFAQEQSRVNLFNNAIAQNLARDQSAFNAANAARNQYISEQYQQRNQPINEISALLSGSQVGQPNFINPESSKIATTDIASLINNRFSQELSLYQQQSTNLNQLIGGILGGIAGVGKGLSDVREKENIKPMGMVFAANENGGEPSKLPIYEYSFKNDPASTRHVGPMAQDVEKIDKRAVSTIGGRKYIDKTRLGSILKVA